MQSCWTSQGCVVAWFTCLLLRRLPLLVSVRPVDEGSRKGGDVVQRVDVVVHRILAGLKPTTCLHSRLINKQGVDGVGVGGGGCTVVVNMILDGLKPTTCPHIWVIN